MGMKEHSRKVSKAQERARNHLGRSPEQKAETPEKTGRSGITSRCLEDRLYPTLRANGKDGNNTGSLVEAEGAAPS